MASHHAARYKLGSMRVYNEKYWNVYDVLFVLMITGLRESEMTHEFVNT